MLIVSNFYYQLTIFKNFIFLCSYPHIHRKGTKLRSGLLRVFFSSPALPQSSHLSEYNILSPTTSSKCSSTPFLINHSHIFIFLSKQTFPYSLITFFIFPFSNELLIWDPRIISCTQRRDAIAKNFDR